MKVTSIFLYSVWSVLTIDSVTSDKKLYQEFSHTEGTILAMYISTVQAVSEKVDKKNSECFNVSKLNDINTEWCEVSKWKFQLLEDSFAGIRTTSYSLEDGENLEEVVRKQINEKCSKRFEVFEAVDKFANCTQAFVSESDMTILNKTSKIFKNLTESACTDGGSKIFKLRSHEVDDCYRATKFGIMGCMTPYSDEGLGESFFSYYGIVKHVYETDCEQIIEKGKGFAECCATMMNRCSEFLGSIYRIILDSIYNEFSCNTNSE